MTRENNKVELITIGITTWNRLELVERMSKSLANSNKPYPYEIRIYDDNSTEFGIDELRAMFPDAKCIVRHAQNMGADLNAEYMYRDFLKNGGDYLFNADSDLIFATNWMEEAVSKIKVTDGVLSLFNTKQHPGEITDDDLIIKEAIGCAGTFFARSVIELICNSKTIQAERGIDWEWSRFLRNKGIRIFTTKSSFVQHIGFIGDHSGSGLFDYGNDFCVDSVINGQIINDSIEEYSSYGYDEQLGYEKRFYLFPFSRVEKRSKIVIYGAGNVGRDFRVQVLNGDYCELIAVVDKNYKGKQDVISPENLRNIQFDHIIIAISKEDIQKEIARDLEHTMGIPEHKIITLGELEPISLRIKDMIS